VGNGLAVAHCVDHVGLRIELAVLLDVGAIDRLVEHASQVIVRKLDLLRPCPRVRRKRSPYSPYQDAVFHLPPPPVINPTARPRPPPRWNRRGHCAPGGSPHGPRTRASTTGAALQCTAARRSTFRRRARSHPGPAR